MGSVWVVRIEQLLVLLIRLTKVGKNKFAVIKEKIAKDSQFQHRAEWRILKLGVKKCLMSVTK